MTAKRIPLRRCSGCGESKPKKELVRVVRTPDGTVVLDTTGKQAGRGAYVCFSAECLKRARKAKRFERSLETSISDEVYEAMQESIRQVGDA